MAHVDDCACRICRRTRTGFTPEEKVALGRTEEQAIMDRVGWSVRAYLDGPWAETAGLRASYGHPEFRMRLSVDPRDRQRWLNVWGRAVADGRRFTAPSTVTDLFAVPVPLVRQDATLLGVFPDPASRWPSDPGCAPGYADQLGADQRHCSERSRCWGVPAQTDGGFVR